MRPCCFLAFGEAGPVDFGNGALENRNEVAAVENDLGSGSRFQRRGIGNLRCRDQIAPADIHAVEPEPVCDPIEAALHCESALRIAGSAHRRGRDLVGRDCDDLQVVGRQHVGAGKGSGRIVRDVDALRGVGALVVDEASPYAEQASVVGASDLDIPILIPLLQRGNEVLAAVLDPFERVPQLDRCSCQRDLLGIYEILCPEAAANVGGDDADGIVVEVQHPHHEQSQLVR